MLLIKGRFIIDNIEELEKIKTNKDGLKKIIDLDYIGMFEFDGNTIQLSRMYIEYFKENYEFRYSDMYDANRKQMIIYCNKKNELKNLEKYLYDNNYSFYEHLKYPNKKNVNNFWWNIDINYFIFFGEEKKELINYFINGYYKIDGGKQLIKEKITKCGYKV